MEENKQEQEEHPIRQDRSVVGIVAATFTWQWIVQTIAAWGFSMWLTKMYNKWKKKKEKKDAIN